MLGLLLDHAPADGRLVRHLRHLGFGVREEVRVVVVPTRRETEVSALLQARLSTAAAAHALVRTGTGVVALVRAGATEDVVTAVRDVLAQAGEHASAVGVSGPVPPALAADALVQARQASHSARQERTSVGWYDRMALGAVLSDAAARARVRALTRASLEPLTEGGAADADLLRSLQVFLDHNGSWETAARPWGCTATRCATGCRASSRLTGLSLDVAHHRVVLYLALATRDDA